MPKHHPPIDVDKLSALSSWLQKNGLNKNADQLEAAIPALVRCELMLKTWNGTPTALRHDALTRDMAILAKCFKPVPGAPEEHSTEAEHD